MTDRMAVEWNMKVYLNFRQVTVSGFLFEQVPWKWFNTSAARDEWNLKISILQTLATYINSILN